MLNRNIDIICLKKNQALCEVIDQRKQELLAQVGSVHNMMEERNKQIADGTLAEDEIDDMAEHVCDSQTTEGSLSEHESEFTSEYDSDTSMITCGRSSEDESDFLISEYDSDCQGQVANGNMVNCVMDELSQNDSNGAMVDYITDELSQGS